MLFKNSHDHVWIVSEENILRLPVRAVQGVKRDGRDLHAALSVFMGAVSGMADNRSCVPR